MTQELWSRNGHCEILASYKVKVVCKSTPLVYMDTLASMNKQLTNGEPSMVHSPTKFDINKQSS